MKTPYSGPEKCISCKGPANLEIKITNSSIPPWYLCEKCDNRIDLEVKWESFGEHCGDEIKCPFCSYEEQDSWEVQDDEDEWACPECERKFDIEVEHITRYTCKRSLCEMPEGWTGEDES